MRALPTIAVLGAVLLAGHGIDRCAHAGGGARADGADDAAGGLDGTAEPGGAADDRAGAAPERLALLVGLDRYAGDGVPALSGCANDVRRAREVLVERFAFDPADVRVLVDAEATHAAIVGAFDEHLLRRAAPGTQVLVWLSGHGSRVPDASGTDAEIARRDSTFVAHDSRTPGRSGEFDLVDDELSALVAALVERGAAVAVVTDSCHSGGVVRGAGDAAALPPRSLPEGDRATDRALLEPFWPPGVPLADDDRAGLRAEGYVHVAACAPWELAREIRVQGADGAERVHGALSWFLLQALESARPGVTWRRLVDEAAVRLATRYPGQSVWVEGALDRRVFEGAFEPPPPGFLARRAAPGTLAIEAGRLHGLRPGSRLAVRAADADEPCATAEVTHLTPTAARARVLSADGDAPPPLPEGALRVVELSRPQADPLALRVIAPDEATRERLAAVARRLAPELARVVAPDNPDAQDADEAYRLALEPDGVVVRDPAGVPIWPASVDEWSSRPGLADPAELAAALGSGLGEELVHRSLLALGAEGGTLDVHARFVPATDAELVRWTSVRARDALASAAAEPGRAAGGGLAVVGGDQDDDLALALIEVKNPLDRDLWVTVLSLPEDRSRNAIWPPPGRRDEALLEPGETLRVPLLVLEHPAWPLARPMRDRYLVILTERFPQGMRSFERGSPLPPVTRSGADPQAGMPAILVQALHQPLTRGGLGRAQPRAEAWGVAALDLLVR